ncbi:hypothetical protein LC612_35605 [Nostoc sp. CHAB 5834]|nr:hypothetical protein [Nostoc sp. CHAB 5834]
MKRLHLAAATAAILALLSLDTQQAKAITIFTSRTDWNTAVSKSVRINQTRLSNVKNIEISS